MVNMDVERGDVNIVSETVRSLLDFVGENQYMINKFSPSIYTAPSTFRNLNPSSFTPRVVSVGPLHRKDKNLQRFEVRKAAFVHNLLSRGESSLKQVQLLTACVEKVVSMLDKIKGSYVDIKSYDDSELAKMMVMDACFILEFIHDMTIGPGLSLQDQYIPYDMVLLENQIPFFVLNGIYECINYKFEESLPLTEFIFPLLKRINLFERRIKAGSSLLYTNHDHILGYLQHCYQPKRHVSSCFPSSTIHSAVELDRAGVKFKSNIGEEWTMAMEVKMFRNYSGFLRYSNMPSLTVPILRIDNFTELVLRNLIAYEQSYVVDPYVTSYARAMDMLIDTHEDVAKLVTSEVIINHIGSNEEAANMINRICKGVAPEHFCYTQQWEKLDSHCKRYWPRKIVRTYFELKHTYFSSPWSVIALFAGIALFVLTVIQTIYTIKSSKTK